MIKISVIIPCYNLGDYIIPCLESIRKQEISKVEYIFVNDGSTDDTLKHIQEFCEDKSYCKVINQPNSGVSAARNAALELASGEYIYLLDGDDIFTDNAVARMVETVEKSDCDVVLSEAIILKDGREKQLSLPLKAGTYTPTELYRNVKVFPTVPQLLYRTEIINSQHLRFDTNLRFGEVYDFTIRFLCFSNSVKVVSQSYFKYTMRHESASHAPNYKKDLSVLDTLRKYNMIGVGFSNIPSFNVTTFKMILSFTYNKYVKLRLKNKEAVANIKILLKNPQVMELVKYVVNCSEAPLKERLLASYIYLTGITGYKFLTRLSI